MLRYSNSRILRSAAILTGPLRAEHPIRPLAHFLSSGGAPDPIPSSPKYPSSSSDSISLSEAKKLMRLVNVEALKRKIGSDDDDNEVIAYADHLEAAETTGVARSKDEAAAFAKVLDEAGVVLLSRDKVYLHPDKLGVDDHSRNYVRKAFDRPSKNIIRGGIERNEMQNHFGRKTMILSQQHGLADDQNSQDSPRAQAIGRNISTGDKRKFLINTLFDLKDSKEAVYGTLDAWVAWERNFPLVSLKRALLVLEKEEQWHRIVQVIKWMLSKGQGTTMGTYEQLIRALEKDNRAEEAHKMWVKKISYDLHSVPWQFLDLMISIYYRNSMLERLVKLFKELESYDRRPPRKSIVRKVADAYEMLGLVDEKDKVLESYSDLLSNTTNESIKSSRKGSRKNDKKAGKRKSKSKEAKDVPVDSDPSEKDVPVDSGPSDEECVGSA